MLSASMSAAPATWLSRMIPCRCKVHAARRKHRRLRNRLLKGTDIDESSFDRFSPVVISGSEGATMVMGVWLLCTLNSLNLSDDFWDTCRWLVTFQAWERYRCWCHIIQVQWQCSKAFTCNVKFVVLDVKEFIPESGGVILGFYLSVKSLQWMLIVAVFRCLRLSVDCKSQEWLVVQFFFRKVFSLW